jgi:hypothetical protein
LLYQKSARGHYINAILKDSCTRARKYNIFSFKYIMIVCVSSKNHRIGMLFLQKLSRRLFFLKSVQNTLLLKVLLLRHHLQYKICLPHHWNVLFLSTIILISNRFSYLNRKTAESRPDSSTSYQMEVLFFTSLQIRVNVRLCYCCVVDELKTCVLVKSSVELRT